MAQNLSILGGISANLNNYVVRPLNAFGLGGFMFDIEGETSVNLTSQITDHFLEDTTNVQDVNSKPSVMAETCTSTIRD